MAAIVTSQADEDAGPRPEGQKTGEKKKYQRKFEPFRPSKQGMQSHFDSSTNELYNIVWLPAWLSRCNLILTFNYGPQLLTCS